MVLSGGVFLNALLTSEVCARLTRDGFRAYRHRLVPPNDGGLSLGQLAVAAARLGEAEPSCPLRKEEPAMCLGIPGKVTETYREHDVLMGKVEFGGVSKRVCLEHVPEAKPSDYVLVHVGFALSRIDEAEAGRVFEFLREMQQLDDLEVPPP